MTSSQLSPKAAFARIWKRLTDAVAEGKRKAGVSAKTESIMEAAKGGKLDMIDLGEDNLFGDPEQGMLDLGEENLFGGTESGDPADRADQLGCQFLLVIQLILQKENPLVLIAWIGHIASCLIIPQLRAPNQCSVIQSHACLA